MMNQDFKMKWIEALRSGKYKQGMHVLKSDDGYFCCLGVAREIGAPHSESERYLLTRETMNFIGINSSIHGRLASMNDNGKSFSEIADWIEENL